MALAAAAPSLASKGVTASFFTESHGQQGPSFPAQAIYSPASAIMASVRPLERECSKGKHNRCVVTTQPVPNQPFLTKRIFGDHLFVHDPISAFFSDGQPLACKSVAATGAKKGPK
mmetsp:Transcript_58556/g.188168  ORF Transcript_58556/g.188168 Transcript_58556/m.188168 type:complete len:116 (-) Transcript_58556:168-515(-)